MARKKKSDIESDILQKARQRFRASVLYEQDNRSEGLDDLRFKLGGLNQWPAKIASDRQKVGRPVITINKIPTFTDQIIGDSRQNKVGIRVRSTGKRGSVQVAEIYTGLIREIERASQAESVYQWGLQGAVDSGRGGWRVDTEYCEDEAFDQVIRLRRFSNPYSFYFDHHADDPTYCDIRYAFVTGFIDKDALEARWPGKSPSDFSGLGLGDDQQYWFEGGLYRIAEYWLKEPVKKKIYLLEDQRVVNGDDWDAIVDELKEREEPYHIVNGIPVPGPAEMPGQQETVINKVPRIIDERIIDSHRVIQYIIDGAQILEGPNEWAGKYIPVVPVWGKEINIEGKKYYRGLIRNAKDPQRMYNYERTEEIERTALAKKPPTRLTPEQIEGHESMYSGEDAYKYQLYNWVPGVPPPIDTPPPSITSGHVTQSAIANDEIRTTTGLEAPAMGHASSSAASGKKELILQSKSATANFEFHDNLERAITYTGNILVDLIPKIYDTERTLTILEEDGTEKEVTINERIVDDETGNEIIINDLSVGKYSVSVTVGPSFSTQKLETVSVLTELISRVPVIGQVGADMIVKNIDFKGNEELAERLRKLLIKQGLIEDPEKNKNPQGGPEQIALMLDIKAKQLENSQKEIEIAQAVVELQKTMSQLRGDLANVAKGAAQGAVMQVLEQIGLLAPQGGEGGTGRMKQ